MLHEIFMDEIEKMAGKLLQGAFKEQQQRQNVAKRMKMFASAGVPTAGGATIAPHSGPPRPLYETPKARALPEMPLVLKSIPM